MRPCKNYEDLIPLYLNDCLSSEEMLEVKNHLNDCESCRRFQMSLTAILAGMEADKVTAPHSYGAELVVALNQRLKKRKTRQKKMLWTIPAFSSVAAVIVITLINLMQINPNNDQWLIQFQQEHSYVSLSEVGYFGEILIDESDDSSDQFTSTTEDISMDVAYEIISELSIPEVDRYVMATSNLDDAEFQNIIDRMKNNIL